MRLWPSFLIPKALHIRPEEPASTRFTDRHFLASADLLLDGLDIGPFPDGDSLRPFGLSFQLVVDDRL